MRQIKVLVVEDSLVFRELLVTNLNKDPAIQVVATATDPYEARDKIIEYKYYIDPAGHYSNPCLSMNMDITSKRVLKKIGEQEDLTISYEEINKFEE